MSGIVELAEQFRAALLRQDAAAMKRLVTAYQQLYGRTQDKLDLLLMTVQSMDVTSPNQIRQLARYKELMDSVASELNKFGVYTETEISTTSRAAIEAAIRDTSAYMRSVGLSSPATINAGAIESLLGFLNPDGPLYARLEMLAPTHTAKIADGLLEAIGLGYNPVKTAKLFENLMGGGLTDALRMTRTAQLYAYREATRANFLANSDVVKGWVWWTALDNSVCMSCVAQHGTVHPLSEKLDDHYNGRCVALPYMGDSVPEVSGEEWFNRQSEEQQKQMMGESKYAAWKDGKFSFSDLSTQHEDGVYGLMRGETSLKDLLGND